MNLRYDETSQSLLFFPMHAKGDWQAESLGKTCGDAILKEKRFLKSHVLHHVHSIGFVCALDRFEFIFVHGHLAWSFPVCFSSLL